MKYNKILKENDYNKSSFLITCVCSIVLLLTLCYFGINSGVKGTYSVTEYKYYNQSVCATEAKGLDSSEKRCSTGVLAKWEASGKISDKCCPNSDFVVDGLGVCKKHYDFKAPGFIWTDALNDCKSMGDSFAFKEDMSPHTYTYCGTSATPAEAYCANGGTADSSGDCCPKGTYPANGYCVKDGYELVNNPGGVLDPSGNEVTSNLVCKTEQSGGTTTDKEEACYYCSDTSAYHWTSSPGNMCSPKTQYTDEDSCTKATATVEYIVSYNANGGSVSPTSQKLKKDGFVTLPTPTKDGDEIFAGWYTAAIGGSFVGKGGASHKVTKTHTLYARWVSPDDKKCYQCSGDKSYVWTAIQPSTSCVEVAKNEAECDDSAQSSGTTSVCYYCDDTKKYTWSATVPGASCTKAQYYTKSTCESAGSGSSNPDPDPDPDSGVGSGGSDEKVTYKATFDPNDGKLEGSSTSTCTANKGESCIIPTLPTANRNGYDHNGWGTTKSCTSGNTNSVSISGDTTFYACWQKTGGDGNPTENPPTGQTTTIAIIWFFGLLAIGYAFYYFKQVRGN